MRRFLFFLFVLMFCLSFVSSAHFIVGYVHSGKGGESADNHVVRLWNSEKSLDDYVTDVIGVSGNSKTSNVYMIDCEMLVGGCLVGDVLTLQVEYDSLGYFSEAVNVTVSPAGYDLAENLSLMSPPSVENVFVDDSLVMPLNQIDLLSSNGRNVYCSAVVNEYDLEPLVNISGTFYDSSYEYYGEVDNNYRYFNDSCFVDSSYGTENETLINCSFFVWYYANSNSWNCRIFASDNSSNHSGFDSTFVNELLSLEVESFVDFGSAKVDNFSDEVEVKVFNRGNVELDLSLSGYGESPFDSNSMVCQGGNNLPISSKRFNLSSSNPVNFFNYNNLSSNSVLYDFNLNSRELDNDPDTFKSTFWRVFVPEGVGGRCSGNIVFSGVKSL